MISNFQIEDICREVKLPLIGVFSKDQLPSRRKVGSYYISLENSDDGNGNGTHWVFCRIFECGKALYFDSFGMPRPQEVAKFLLTFKPIATNNRQIQDVHSQKCRWFCLALDYFLTYEHRSNDPFEEFDDFLNMYSFKTKLNDKILDDYLQRHTIE